MKAEIISIGTELLVGSILNTNSKFLSERLAENAIDVYHHTTVGDNVPRIVQALDEAANRADILITSGGLGPTADDVTVEAVGCFLGKTLYFHKPTHSYIVSLLKKRRHSMNALIKKQCFIPQGVQVLKNLKGTAPGLLCETIRRGQKKWLLVLPGPPRELEPMLLNQALPLLLKSAKIKKETFVVRSVRITGMVESQVAQKTTDLLNLHPPLTVGIYAKPGQVELKIMSKASSSSAARQAADRVEKQIRKRLGTHVFGIDNDNLASVIGALLRKNKKTLSIAESCTGGLVSHLVTETPGSSDYFIGGIVAYSNKIKTSLLGVQSATIKKHGAVSQATAREMAAGVRAKFGADYGLAVSGIAGPTGGTKQKPVGFVCMAISSKQKTVAKEHLFFGTRSEIKARSANKLLDFFRLHLYVPKRNT